VAQVDLDTVETGFECHLRPKPVLLSDPSDVLVSAARVIEPVGLKRREGPSAATPLERLLATGPACPTCAETAAPESWTASVSRRSPATDSLVSIAQ